MSLSRKLAMLIIEERTTLREVVSLLSKYKMLSLLPSIKQALMQVALQVGKKDSIQIESPFPLSDESIQKIKGIVGDKTAEHEVILSTHVLAGFKARWRGMIYDGSAERIIKQLTNR